MRGRVLPAVALIGLALAIFLLVRQPAPGISPEHVEGVESETEGAVSAYSPLLRTGLMIYPFPLWTFARDFLGSKRALV
jgi:hypothetical protein